MKIIKIERCAVCPYLRISQEKAKDKAGAVFCSGLPLGSGVIADSAHILENCPLDNHPAHIEFQPLDTPFPCDKCGCCCEMVDCPHFNKKTRLCKCYADRPVVCRVDAVSLLMDRRIDPAIWREANRQMCRRFQAAKKLHDSV